MGFLLVFLGSGLGGAFRHGVGLVALRLFGFGVPAGTLLINVAGSFLMGIVAEYWALKSGLLQPLRLFLTTGIIGGFTTFSTFSLESVLLWERGQPLAAVAYVAASNLLSIGALFGGFWMIRLLDGRGIL